MQVLDNGTSNRMVSCSVRSRGITMAMTTASKATGQYEQRQLEHGMATCVALLYKECASQIFPLLLENMNSNRRAPTSSDWYGC